MAFSDLKPVRIFDEATGSTYIIGDVFGISRFGMERPVIYSWDMVKYVTEDKRSFVFECGKSKYSIPKKCFIVREDYFRAVALIECAQRQYEFSYAHQKRILPLKMDYFECLPEKDAYIGEAEIDENDTAAAFVMMMNLRLVKLLWPIAALIAVTIFALLHVFIGVTRDNLLYFIPISIAGGGIITLIIYLICHAVARGRYQSMAGADPASAELITFIISQYGFAACESCVCDKQDLIPWGAIDYFIETNKMFIFYKDNSAVVFIPKKAFGKKHVGGVADLIALRLEQR